MPRLAEVIGLSRQTLYAYCAARFRSYCNYVAIAQTMLDLLADKDLPDVQRDVWQRRLDCLARMATIANASLPNYRKNDTQNLQSDENEKNTKISRHLLVRDAHFRGTKILTIYESSKYYGKKITTKRA